MREEAEEKVLIDSASKLENLLYQYVKLFDRLTVEHSLMTDRELKLLKELEKLHEVINKLNKFSPEVTNIIQNTTQQVINKNREDLSALIKTLIERPLDQHLNYCSKQLYEATNKIKILTNDYDMTCVKYFLTVVSVGVLVGIIAGMIIGHYIF